MDTKKVEAALKELEESGMGMIDPEAIVGFRIGLWMDLDAYRMRGMMHPKCLSYYEQLAHLAKADQTLVFIFESLKTTQHMDLPITVWATEGDRGPVELLCLDGATRLSCVGVLRAYDRKMFETVPAILFKGTREQARAEMIRRNLTTVGRPLDPGEFAESVIILKRWGWSDSDVRKHLGISPRMSQYMDRCLRLHERGIGSLKLAVREKRIPFYTALRICSMKVSRQEAIMESIGSGVVGKLPSNKIWEGIPKDAKAPMELADAADAVRHEIEEWCIANDKMNPERQQMLKEIGKASMALRSALAREYM